MHFTRKLFATSIIASACAVPAALLLSATAAAEPAPTPPMPSVPGMPFLNQLSPANAPAMLQGLASAFTGAPAATAAAPVASPSTATASVALPQTPALPTTPLAAAPAAIPAAVAPAQGLIPTAEVSIPQGPINPLALPPQLSFPSDLTSLLPPGVPLANLLPTSAPAVATAPAIPTATAPALPAATTGLGALSPLMFPTSALP